MSDSNYSYMEVSARRKRRNQFISVLIIVAIVLVGVIVWGWVELQRSRNAERIKLALNQGDTAAFASDTALPSGSDLPSAAGADTLPSPPVARNPAAPAETVAAAPAAPVEAEKPVAEPVEPAPAPVAKPRIEPKPKAEPPPKAEPERRPEPAPAIAARPKAPEPEPVAPPRPRPSEPAKEKPVAVKPAPREPVPAPVSPADPIPSSPSPTAAKPTPAPVSPAAPPAVAAKPAAPAAPSTAAPPALSRPAPAAAPAKAFQPEDLPAPREVKPSEETRMAMAAVPNRSAASPNPKLAVPGGTTGAYTTGLNAYRAGDYVNAIRHFSQVPKPATRKRGETDRDEYVMASFYRGQALMKTNRLSEAVSAYQNVLAYEKYFPVVNMNLGICYVELRQYGKANQAFEAVLRDRSFIEPAMYDEVMQRTKYFWALAWTRLYKNTTNEDKRNYYQQQAVMKWKDYQDWFAANDKFKNDNLRAENYLKTLQNL